jgi:hypothetical protein
MATEQEMIDEIMDCFEFEKVHKTMVALDWKWVSCKEVPELHEIKKAAREHLKRAIAEGTSWSGGFRATYDGNINVLELMFVVEDWDTRD